MPLKRKSPPRRIRVDFLWLHIFDDGTGKLCSKVLRKTGEVSGRAADTAQGCPKSRIRYQQTIDSVSPSEYQLLAA